MDAVFPNQRVGPRSSEPLRTHFASASNGRVEEEGCDERGTAFPPFSEFKAESCHLQRYEMKLSPAVRTPAAASFILSSNRSWGSQGDGPVPVNCGILHRAFNYLTLLNRKGCLALSFCVCKGLVEPRTGDGLEVIHR